MRCPPSFFEEVTELRAKVRAMSLAFAHMPGVVVAMFDLQYTCVLQEGMHVPGVPNQVGKHVVDLIPPERAARFLWLYDRAVAGETTRADYPIDRITFETTCMPVRDPGGEIRYVLFYSRDVTAERIAQAAGAKDSLTGLSKRGVLQAHVDSLLRRALPFAVLFMDLDNFKSVNDTMGHKAGDVLLEKVARTLQSTTRAGDLCVRLGGDEFVIVLADATHPRDAAKRILHAVLEVTEPFGAGASIGFAEYPQNGATLDALLESADRAMYHVKKIMGGDGVADSERPIE